MIFYDPLADIEIVCFTLKASENENLAKAENAEDKNLYLGGMQMMPKTHYVLIFLMLIVIIFLLIYIAADVAEIRNKTRAMGKIPKSEIAKRMKILNKKRRERLNERKRSK